tara:strand:+ start:154 stop:285 length:132 start_codon:yes stop_codon:yes gene_type:complete
VQRKRTVVAANVRERFTRLGLAISGNVDGYVCIFNGFSFVVAA